MLMLTLSIWERAKAFEREGAAVVADVVYVRVPNTGIRCWSGDAAREREACVGGLERRVGRFRDN